MSTWAHAADPFTGRVVAVHDGDTITIERASGERVRVRLWGVDCPEGDQPWGSDAERRHTVRTVWLMRLGIRDEL